MKYTLENAFSFSWDGLQGRAYNNATDFSAASAAYFEITGSHGKVKTEVSDRVYFVVAGKGEFTINDSTLSVEMNDVIIVPKNTRYDYRAVQGTLKLFLVHTPAYDKNAEILAD